MALSSLTSQQVPYLYVSEISEDTYVRKNFENLVNYFQANNQLVGFRFFSQTFSAAVKNFKIAHGLGFIPQDLIITSATGSGTVQFNRGLWDKNNLDLTTTGACRIRFFIGTYWNNVATVALVSSDVTQSSALVGTNATALTPPTVAGTTATTTSTTTTTTTTTTVQAPTGSIMMYGGSTAPSGYLLCDGSSYLQSAYPALYAVIGQTYGGTTGYFKVPNTSGIFVRGAGSQTISSISYSGTNGTVQGDQIQGHQHGVTDPTHTHAPSSEAWCLTNNTVAGVGSAGNLGANTSSNITAAASTGITVSTPTTDGTNGTPRTGAETRPANIALNHIIKT